MSTNSPPSASAGIEDWASILPPVRTDVVNLGKYLNLSFLLSKVDVVSEILEPFWLPKANQAYFFPILPFHNRGGVSLLWAMGEVFTPQKRAHLTSPSFLPFNKHSPSSVRLQHNAREVKMSKMKSYPKGSHGRERGNRHEKKPDSDQ